MKETCLLHDGNSALNLTAHALWGAVEAYAGNRNIASGAVGAVSGEVAANLIAETLYGKTANQLNQEEKTTVSTLSQVAAGIVGGTAANSSDGAMIAAKTAKDAVEHNAVNKKQAGTTNGFEGIMNISVRRVGLAKEIKQKNIC